MARTGISRATLNNYISLNLIPSPEVRKPEDPGGPTKIGYFPDWVVERIEKVHQLKDQGMRMSQIALHFMDDKIEIPPAGAERRPETSYQWMDQLVFPAILVNQTWEILWLNDKKTEQILAGGMRRFPAASKNSLFDPNIVAELKKRFANWEEILLRHIRLAKGDLQASNLEHFYQETDSPLREEVMRLWFRAEEMEDIPFSRQELSLTHHAGRVTDYTLISWRMAEGTLLLYVPANMQFGQMIDLAMGNMKLANSVLYQRTPSLRSLCALAARLESDLHLRTALPPQEYFALMNQIILGANKCFIDYGGTPGRSFRQGAVCFFLAESDAAKDYFFQALLCGQSLQKMIRQIDNQWKYKQTWKNTLRMSIGVHCGHEWLGAVPSSLAFEFTVVGDTVLQAIKLSEFSQRGAIWASKEVIENLSRHNRERVEFGIRLGVHQERFLSPSIYLPIRDLMTHNDPRGKRLQVIRDLVVSEVLSIVV
jgi:class 3 adenylate cyclase